MTGPGHSGRALGRIPEHDPASRWYAFAPHTAAPAPGRVLWPRWSPILDQGQVGSCTGNAMAGWLGCAPHCNTAADGARWDETAALGLYQQATALDHIPGHYPPDDTGSSGLAVAKAAQRAGYIRGYSWAFTTAAMLHALQRGPVIAGIPWFDGFNIPGRIGPGVISIDPGDEIVGGHEIVIRGWDPTTELLTADNSWGPDWGQAGSFRIPLATWRILRSMGGDVTIPRL